MFRQSAHPPLKKKRIVYEGAEYEGCSMTFHPFSLCISGFGQSATELTYILVRAVDTINRKGTGVELKLKNFTLLLILDLTDDEFTSMLELFNPDNILPIDTDNFHFLLIPLSNPLANTDIFPVSEYCQQNLLKDMIQKRPIKLRGEFKTPNTSQAGDFYTVHKVNATHAICPQYPEWIIIPVAMRNDYKHIVESAKAREGGRFPLISHINIYRNAYDGQHKVKTLLHSSSLINNIGPLVDKAFFATFKAPLVIIDLRPISNQKYSAPKPVDLIAGEEIVFLSKPMPEVVDLGRRLAKLMSAIETGYDEKTKIYSYLSAVAHSGWLSAVESSISAAEMAVRYLESDQKRSITVLLQGSTGVDSELVVACLAQIMVDDDCRTLFGFVALICREWIGNGHPFRNRCRYGPYNVTATEQPTTETNYIQGMDRFSSPYFLLFIDCVWQLQRMYPCSFHFNELFLITLVTHAYFSEYDTFMFNCERDEQCIKKALKSDENRSLWAHLLGNGEMVQSFLNPTYDPSGKDQFILPHLMAFAVVEWRTLYARAFLPATAVKSAKEKDEAIRRLIEEKNEKVAIVRKKVGQLRAYTERLRANEQ